MKQPTKVGASAGPMTTQAHSAFTTARTKQGAPSINHIFTLQSQKTRNRCTRNNGRKKVTNGTRSTLACGYPRTTTTTVRQARKRGALPLEPHDDCIVMVPVIHQKKYARTHANTKEKRRLGSNVPLPLDLVRDENGKKETKGSVVDLRHQQ